MYVVYFSPSSKKIRVSEDASGEGKAGRAKTFLAEMKKSLSRVNFDHIVQALQTYKKTDDLDVLLTETSVLTEDTNTHGLLRGKSSAVTRQASCETHTVFLSADHQLHDIPIILSCS